MTSMKLPGAMGAVLLSGASLAHAQAIMLEGGKATDMVLLPKFLGILAFDQANEGAHEAHVELANPGTLGFLGPTPEDSVAGRTEIMTTAAMQKLGAVMLSYSVGDQIAPAALPACRSRIAGGPISPNGSTLSVSRG